MNISFKKALEKYRSDYENSPVTIFDLKSKRSGRGFLTIILSETSKNRDCLYLSDDIKVTSILLNSIEADVPLSMFEKLGYEKMPKSLQMNVTAAQDRLAERNIEYITCSSIKGLEVNLLKKRFFLDKKAPNTYFTVFIESLEKLNTQEEIDKYYKNLPVEDILQYFSNQYKCRFIVCNQLGKDSVNDIQIRTLGGSN